MAVRLRSKRKLVKKKQTMFFHRKDTYPIEIIKSNIPIKLMTTINVFGVTFDSKLNWSQQVTNTINKCKKCFTESSLSENTSLKCKRLTSSFYSILYYNFEIWHISAKAWTQAIDSSTNVLKLAPKQPDRIQSFFEVHSACKRTFTNNMMMAKHSTQLHKLYSMKWLLLDWIELNFNQTFYLRKDFQCRQK